MATVDPSNAKRTRMWGIILLAFGAFVLALSDGRVPDRSSLTEITGTLRSLEKTTSKGGGLSAVRFSLSTDSRHFSYHSAAGDIDQVWRSLNQAGHAEIRVLIDPADSHSPPLDGRTYYAVLEVQVEHRVIRPYAQIVESLRTNNLTGAAMGYGTIAIGIALLVAALLRR